MPAKDLGRLRVVLDHEDERTARLDLSGFFGLASRPFLGGHAVRRQSDREGRPLPNLAFDADVATVQNGKALRQRQAETGAFLSAPRPGVELLKLTAKTTELASPHPAPCVGPRYFQRARPAARAHGPFVAEKLRKPDDRVQRRSWLVAHARQEAAFRAVGSLGLGLRVAQLLCSLLHHGFQLAGEQPLIAQ